MEGCLCSEGPSVLPVICWFLFTHMEALISPEVNGFCSHSPWLLCPLQLSLADEAVHQGRAGSPGCKPVPYCARQSHTLPPSSRVTHHLDNTDVLKNKYRGIKSTYLRWRDEIYICMRKMLINVNKYCAGRQKGWQSGTALCWNPLL